MRQRRVKYLRLKKNSGEILKSELGSCGQRLLKLSAMNRGMGFFMGFQYPFGIWSNKHKDYRWHNP
jgi:hypothetical protein